MQCLTTLEAEYQLAKVRLLDAQQEKLEAAAAFLSARAALHQGLEALWPSPSESASQHCECAPVFGYDEAVYG